MLNLYIYIGVAAFIVAAFFYVKHLGKQQAENKQLKDDIEAISDAKKIRDDISDMSDDELNRLL